MLKSKIDKPYEKHDCKRICQGDILIDFQLPIASTKSKNVKSETLFFPYLIVVSQDCDLDEHFKKLEELKDTKGILKLNQFLPNILVLPAFPSELAREGQHLKKIFNITKDRIGSDIWGRIIQNNDKRYHFLPAYQEFKIPSLLLDFKTYMTVAYEDLSLKVSTYYIGTINELFREKLSRRFCGYLSRIGLPELEDSK
jgi:hypothetical protein